MQQSSPNGSEPSFNFQLKITTNLKPTIDRPYFIILISFLNENKIHDELKLIF